MGSEVPIGRRNLLADKVKFLLAVGGVTLAVMLMLVIQSLYQGVRRDHASFVRSLPGDVWVAQKGFGDLVVSNSFLTERHADDVRTIPGVTAVHRLYGRLTSFQVDGDEASLYLWAVAPDGVLTPDEERALPEPGTIIIDRTFAKQEGVSRGDVLEYEGKELAIAKVGHVGNLLFARFAFIHPDDYARLFGTLGAANFFLVSLGPNATDDTLEEIPRRVEGSSVYTTDEFVRVAEAGPRHFLPVIQVIVAISFIVGLAVLSLTIYSTTIERAREYGIMKVLGASRWRLYRIVLGQAAIMAVLGFSAGVGLALLLNRVAREFVPDWATYMRWQEVALAFGLVALMAFLASYLPINRVARVDPASVFRA